MNYFEDYRKALQSKTYLSVKKWIRKVGLKKVILSCFVLAVGIAGVAWDLSAYETSVIKKLLNNQSKSDAMKVLSQMEAQSSE